MRPELVLVSADPEDVIRQLRIADVVLRWTAAMGAVALGLLAIGVLWGPEWLLVPLWWLLSLPGSLLALIVFLVLMGLEIGPPSSSFDRVLALALAAFLALAPTALNLAMALSWRSSLRRRARALGLGASPESRGDPSLRRYGLVLACASGILAIWTALISSAYLADFPWLHAAPAPVGLEAALAVALPGLSALAVGLAARRLLGAASSELAFSTRIALVGAALFGCFLIGLGWVDSSERMASVPGLIILVLLGLFVMGNRRLRLSRTTPDQARTSLQPAETGREAAPRSDATLSHGASNARAGARLASRAAALAALAVATAVFLAELQYRRALASISAGMREADVTARLGPPDRSIAVGPEAPAAELPLVLREVVVITPSCRSETAVRAASYEPITGAMLWVYYDAAGEVECVERRVHSRGFWN